LIAELTWFFRWGPFDAEALPLSRLVWWRKQATRMQGSDA
jgi:hypothetical protein